MNAAIEIMPMNSWIGDRQNCVAGTTWYHCSLHQPLTQSHHDWIKQIMFLISAALLCWVYQWHLAQHWPLAGEQIIYRLPPHLVSKEAFESLLELCFVCEMHHPASIWGQVLIMLCSPQPQSDYGIPLSQLNLVSGHFCWLTGFLTPDARLFVEIQSQSDALRMSNTNSYAWYLFHSLNFCSHFGFTQLTRAPLA